MSAQVTVWDCKIGIVGLAHLPMGADAPLRCAVQDAFTRTVGIDAEFCFSGWGGKLTESELACVEKRLPSEAYYKAERARAVAPDLVEALLLIRAKVAMMQDMSRSELEAVRDQHAAQWADQLTAALTKAGASQ